MRRALRGAGKEEEGPTAGTQPRLPIFISYKINLPEEVDSCQTLIANSKQTEAIPLDQNTELDYYNVTENRLKIFERDNYKCHYCGKQLTRFTATLDHIQPVSEGGDNSFDNLVTACLHCNSRRGSQPVMNMFTKGD